MPFHQSEELRFFTFDSLSECGVAHAVFTRRGGVSSDPWASLNVGGTVGDDPASVFENRQRSFRALQRSMENMFDVWQVHGTNVVCSEGPRQPNMPHQKADAILTDRPGLTLFMRFADCVPILLCDPKRNTVGLVHAGWQGTVQRTAAFAIQAMHDRYSTQPKDILAAIGPSIASHHYEVGPEVVAKIEQCFGRDAPALLNTQHGNPSSRVEFDLWLANRLILEQAGVIHIEIAGICTACHIEDWYSHRGEKGTTGRFGVMIGW